MAVGLVVAALAGCFVAAAFPHSGLWVFLKRWIITIGFIVGMVLGGMALGAVMRNAWCQGFWICD